MKKLLFDNIAHKIAAIVISVLLWKMVQTLNESPARQSFNVPLKFVNKPEDLDVTGRPTWVRVDVSFLGSEIINVDPDNVTATVNLKGAKPGTNGYPVDLNYSPAIRSLAKLTPKPDRVEITLERIVSRVIDVDAQFVGRKEGFKLDRYNLDPPKVRIEGPETSVNAAIIARVTIDLSNVEPAGSYEKQVEVLDKDDRPLPRITVDPQNVVFRPSLAALPTTASFVVAPVWKGTPKFGFRVTGISIEPNQVKLVGDAEALAAITTIETFPIDITDTDTSKEIEINLVVPNGLRVAGSATVKVKVIISKDPNSGN